MASSNFKGMLGIALARQQMTRQAMQNAQVQASKPVVGNGGRSGKYLFVANANCCSKCADLGRTPHFFNIPDVAYITHPNCKCATIEVPAGLSPAEMMQWAQAPTGEMRYGWNYGISFAPVKITDRNRDNQFIKWNNRVRPTEGQPRTRRKVRASVTEEQIAKARRAFKRGTAKPAEDLTDSIKKLIEAEKKRRIPVNANRNKRTAEQIKAHNDAVRNNASGLRKGTIWNPNATSRKRKVIVTENPNLNNINAAFGADFNVIPAKTRKTTKTLPKRMSIPAIGGTSLARSKYDEERKRQKRLKKLMKQLGM